MQDPTIDEMNWMFLIHPVICNATVKIGYLDQISRSHNTSSEIISIIWFHTISRSLQNYYSNRIILLTNKRLIVEVYENKFIRLQAK